MSAPKEIKQAMGNNPFFIENVVPGVDAIIAYEVKRDEELVRYWFKDGSTFLTTLNRKGETSDLIAVTNRLAVIRKAVAESN